MINEFLGKRQSFAHQPRTTLAKGVVETFNMTGLATGFINGLMTFGGQNAGVCPQEIGVTHGALPIVGWKRVPQILSSLGIAGTNGTPHNQTCFGIDSQPQPNLVGLVSDK